MKFAVVVVSALCLFASVDATVITPLDGNPTYGVNDAVNTFEQLQDFFPAGTFGGANDLLTGFGLGQGRSQFPTGNANGNGNLLNIPGLLANPNAGNAGNAGFFPNLGLNGNFGNPGNVGNIGNGNAGNPGNVGNGNVGNPGNVGNGNAGGLGNIFSQFDNIFNGFTG